MVVSMHELIPLVHIPGAKREHSAPILSCVGLDCTSTAIGSHSKHFIEAEVGIVLVPQNFHELGDVVHIGAGVGGLALDVLVADQVTNISSAERC